MKPRDSTLKLLLALERRQVIGYDCARQCKSVGVGARVSMAFDRENRVAMRSDEIAIESIFDFAFNCSAVGSAQECIGE